MVKRRKKAQRERRRAGSHKRDQKHRPGGDFNSFKLPDNVKLFQPDAKPYRIDIVEYKVGEGNPYADPGEWYYERTYWVHRSVGVENSTFVCPMKTAGKSCPICEEQARLARDPDGDEDEIRAMRPKERQLWLVRDRDDADAGVQVWDFSNFNFGALLDDLRKEADEDEKHIIDFSDPDGGSYLKVKFKKESGGGYSYLKALSIDFKPRPNGLEEELMEHGICLDDILIVPEYDVLKSKFFELEGLEGDDGDDEEQPKTKKKTKKKRRVVEEEEELDEELDEDEPDAEEEPETRAKGKRKKATPKAEDAGITKGCKVEHEEFGTCAVTRISGDGTSLTLEDEDGDKHKAVGVDEVELVEEEEGEDDEIPFEIEEGMLVTHDEHGKCEVLRVSKSGKLLTLEDSDGEIHKGVSVADVSVVEEANTKPKAKAESKTKSKTKPEPKQKKEPELEPEEDEDEDDEDWDDWNEEDDEDDED